MDLRKTKEARERASKRFKGRKPKLIPLTQEQMDSVIDIIKLNKSTIITQELWRQLQSVFGEMSAMTYARRASVSKFKIRIGFDWDEYRSDIHSSKALVQIRCSCGINKVIIANKLMSRKHREQLCTKCYARKYIYDNPTWRANNSAKQLISQNRPETVAKHSENSRLLWVGERGDAMRAAQFRTVSKPEYKDKMAQIMRNKWASDKNYRAKVNGKGVYCHNGIYQQTISYDSKLELAFLLWCSDNEKNVVRCEFSIPYVDPEDGKEHDYYPDFIIENNSIIEVKGQRWIDASPNTYKAKIEALMNYCIDRGLSYRVVLDGDLKAYAKRATEYHETQKQKNSSV